MASTALSEYERRRLDNIRRNEDMMSSLLLHRKVSDLAASTKKRPPSKRHTPPTPTKKPKSPVVIRRSLRTRGIPPGSSPDAPPTSLPSPPAPPPARKRNNVSIHEAYLGEPSTERELLDALLDGADGVPIEARRKLVFSDGGDWDPADSMVLKPQNVKRFLPGRILSVGFFPFKDRSLVVAGDKFGHLGLWDVDRSEVGEGDGTYLYAPHSAPVSAIVVQPFTMTKVFTSSYDGFIRLMDIANESFNVAYTSNDVIYSACQQLENRNTLYFGEGNGLLGVWDERTGKLCSSWHLHELRINTIDFNLRNTNMFATSSSDGTVSLWDLRRIKREKPNQLSTIQHMKAVHSAFFSPGGDALATTSLDDHVRILTGEDFSNVSMIRHNNRTGRWVSTFRAIWGWDDSYLFVGNMDRAVDVLSSSKLTTVSLRSEYITAIPSRLAAHPFKRGSLACSTAGGQIYLWTS